MTYTLGSLFTGIGGIDLAFVRAGFDVSFQVEIDSYCRKVLAKHAPEFWPNAQIFEDVKHVGATNLPTVNVLAGGFPCQDISSAGKRAGIKEGTRSGLWLEFKRIIGEIRPRIVMLENVAAITSRDGARVLADLTALGYDAEWGIIPASAVGAPHERERWWCVAYPQSYGDLRERSCVAATPGASQNDGAESDCSYSDVVNSHNAQSTQPNDALCTGRNTANDASCETVYANSKRQQEQRSAFTTQAKFSGVKRPSEARYESVLGRIVDGVSRQLDSHRWPAGRGPFQYEWEPPRSLNNVADRRLRNKALGNAVVPQVVQPIAEAIRSYLEEIDSASGTPTGDVPEAKIVSLT